MDTKIPGKKHKTSGNTQGAADTLKGCNDVLDAARDSGCAWATI